VSPAGLERRLGFVDATSMVVGGVVGSAIFLIPATLLRSQPSPLAGMLVLAAAGILSYFGALAYGELGSMYPETGGEYVYLREIYGPLAGFLLGWTFFLVIQSGGIATLAVGFSTLLGTLIPLNERQARAASILLIGVLTAINCAGVRPGARVNNFFTLLKLSGLLWMIGAVWAHPRSQTPSWDWPTGWTWWQFSAALVPALWAYEGWNMTAFVAGEIRDPQKNLPRALATGLAAVILIYCVSFGIYLRVLTPGEIVQDPSVATTAVRRVLGDTGALWVTLTMIAAVVGCTNTCILACARVYFAQASDGLFFSSFARVHPRFHTPAVSLWAQAVWSGLLAWTGSYEMLFSYVTFGAWIFYGFAVAGVIVLRRRNPDALRPFRMWGYPALPVVFVGVAAAFVLSTIIGNPGSSLIGLGIIAAGIPLYFLRVRRVSQHLPS
jgi:basic amino acid/polyamine antiporter, APA family